MGIAVSGSTGFVGHALCAAIARQNTVLNPIEIARHASESVKTGCVLASAGGALALRQSTVLVHLAARVHVMHDTSAIPLEAFREVNVHGTLNLAQQAAEEGVKKFIFVSSVKVSGEFTRPGHPFTEAQTPNPQDAYGVSKHEAEQGLRQIAAATGMELVIIRPPLVYGPGVKANFAALMRAVQSGWPVPLGAIQNKRSLVALDNLVDFIITCINHPMAANQTFLISDGEDLSTTELVRGLAQAAGVPARLLPVPVWMLEWAGRVVGKGEAVQRLCGNLQIDSSKARNLLDWRPKVSVKEGLRRAVAGTMPS